MLNRNLIWTGLLIGLILPALLYVILLNLFSLLEIKGAASSTGLSQNFPGTNAGHRGTCIKPLAHEHVPPPPLGTGHAGRSGGNHRPGTGVALYLWNKTFLKNPAVK